MKNVGAGCWEGEIIIFLTILASSLQPSTDVQLALLTLGSVITRCPKRISGPDLQGYFLSMQFLSYTEAQFLIPQAQNTEFPFAGPHENFVGPIVHLSVSCHFPSACRGWILVHHFDNNDAFKWHHPFSVTWGSFL